MKKIDINTGLLSRIFAVLFAFFVIACDDDDFNGNVVDVDTLLTEAKNLIETSEEGIDAGDFKPGSIQALQDVVTWVEWTIDNAGEQSDIDDAANKLSIHIERFKVNTVALAIPWIKQEPGTYIQISDNIKSVIGGAFTMELDVYIVDLNQRGWSNNLFSCEQDGPDSGFGVRYFGDGKIQVVVGNNGWKDTGDQAGAGTMKAGEWMHVAFTNSGEHQKLYVNGVEVASQDQHHLVAASVPLVIGNSPKWTDRAVNAMVKDVRIWNVERTAQQIQDNKDADLTGTEAGLEMFLPLQADLGKDFKDVSGNYTAKFVKSIDWVLDGIPPVVELSFASLEDAKVNLNDLKGEVVEGASEGDYPVGTIDYIESLVAEADDVIANAKRQDQIDEKASDITLKIALIKMNLVADAEGIYIDREKSSAIGLRITPNYTPQGDYTVEFDVRVKTLGLYGTGEFFNNGEYGIWVYGYQELTEEGLRNAGGLWNFTNAGAGWQGPKTDPLVISSGVWQHVAIVHDNTARTTKLFVDGVEKAVQEDIGAPNVSGWGEMWLGNGWGKMNGSIKDFRLWDVARSAADLNADIDGTETGLNAYFPLDKVAGVKFNDVTGNYKGEMRGIEWNK